MKLLLDTHCWLWWFAKPERFSPATIEKIADDNNEIWLSVASVWEMGIKTAIGKLSLPEPIDSYVSTRMMQLGAKSLEIQAHHALKITRLPIYHRDPFDRMLIVQAQVEEMTLVSADSVFSQYNVSILWA
ncbi:MAG: type II toxin-antitoxin system VapC family toxin [Halothece sp. Uz-M2-17]|nr:type II toxin-antitoxin system VapC family toxin [Halothece sp. Uz-M2-17]